MSNLIKKMAIILLSAIIFGALFYFILFFLNLIRQKIPKDKEFLALLDKMLKT